MGFGLLPISNRCILTLQGADRFSFLQGLITNDLYLLQKQEALYAALLSPQGRFLHDFIITEQNDTLRLEVEKNRIEDLKKRLMLYKLRSQVIIADHSESYQVAAFGGSLHELPSTLQAYAYSDPRHASLGLRLVIPKDYQISFSESFSVYDEHRISLVIPDGSRDMVPEKAIPLEYGFDSLHAISWTKGCYIGQELTARTKHLGVVRKGVFPAIYEGTTPALGTDIYGEGQKVGTTLSSCGNKVLCRLKIEALQNGAPLTYEGGNLSLLSLPKLE